MTRSSGGLVKVIMYDDHPVYHLGVEQAFARIDSTRFQFTGVLHSKDFLKACNQQKFDVGIFDLDSPDKSGLEILAEIRRTQKELKLIILTCSQNSIELRDAKNLGAIALLHKSSSLDQMINVFNHINEIQNSCYVDPTIERIIAARPEIKFSKRQCEVLKLIVQGRQSKEIAKALQISHETVREYREIVMQKTKSRNIAELVRWFYDNGRHLGR